MPVAMHERHPFRHRPTAPPLVWTPSEERQMLDRALSERIPAQIGPDENRHIRALTFAHAAWIIGGRRVVLVADDARVTLMDRCREQALRMPEALASAKPGWAVAIRFERAVPLGAEDDRYWAWGGYAWAAEMGSVEVLPVILYPDGAIPADSSRLGGEGDHVIATALSGPEEEPYPEEAIVGLLAYALLDERIGRVIPWRPEGLTGQRDVRAFRGCVVRRLVLAKDASHVTSTVREPAPVQVPVPQDEPAPSAPPSAHVVGAHKALRWCRLESAGLEAALDAEEAGRVRRGADGELYAVPRDVRPHVRGGGPGSRQVERAERVVGSGR